MTKKKERRNKGWISQIKRIIELVNKNERRQKTSCGMYTVTFRGIILCYENVSKTF